MNAWMPTMSVLSITDNTALRNENTIVTNDDIE
jgi:hypothetical protein